VYWQPEKTLNQAGDTLGGVLRGLGDLSIWLGVVVAPLLVPVAIVYLIVRQVRKKNMRVANPTALPHADEPGGK
jgi:hypothetical protein